MNEYEFNINFDEMADIYWFLIAYMSVQIIAVEDCNWNSEFYELSSLVIASFGLFENSENRTKS